MGGIGRPYLACIGRVAVKSPISGTPVNMAGANIN